MDFVSGALPNVMFLVGIIAIGIGLGIEFKIVEIKGQLGKGGRAAAMGIGAALIAASIYIYTRPPQTTSAPSTASAAPAASAQAPAATEAAAPAPTATAVPATPTPEPTATAVPATPTPEPTATAVPATPTPEPTATAVPATPTPEPTATAQGVVVPDIRGKSPKDVEKLLKEHKLQLGEKQDECKKIGASDSEEGRARRGQIICQSPAPDSQAEPGTRVDYVVAGGKGDDD